MMTANELLKAIVVGNEITSEMETKAKEILAKAQAKASAKNSKAKEKLAKENAPLFAKLEQYMQNHKTVIASEVASVLGVSTPKASALCRKMVELGTVSVKDTKITGKGTCKAYTLIK